MSGAGNELLVTSAYTEKQLQARFGKPAYSYRVVKLAFNSLLRRWAPSTDIDDPAGQLSAAVKRAQSQGREAIHLSFLPLQDHLDCPEAVNVAVPAWEFPDLPAEALGGNPRENWVRQCEKLDLVITHTQFSRNAFLKAGVQTPVHVVPVPVNPAFFEIPRWRPGQKVTLAVPCHIFCPGFTQSARAIEPAPPVVKSLAKRAFASVKRWFPERLTHSMQRLKHAIHVGRTAYKQFPTRITFNEEPRLDLEGIVYTSVFNPADNRKNWEDMLSAYLYALADRPDATLVFKITTNKQDAAFWLRQVADRYLHFRIPHVCKVAFVTAYLSETQMADLVRGSTFYMNSSRAEGSCLPLQDFLSAGRPAIAPPNTGMADSLDTDSSFLVESSVEPSCWPHDPEQRLLTTWHRINWESLREQIRLSYRLAKDEPMRITRMGALARAKMQALVGPEAVWPLLKLALDEAVVRSRSRTPVRIAA